MFRQSLPFVIAIAPLLGLALNFPAGATNAPKVTGPHSHDNLSIFFIHGKSAGGPVPLTLAEALDKGWAEVRETDTVSQLVIENKGNEAVFIQAGDIVKGGKQDRVVTASFTLEPKSKPVEVPVYCVEAGRWAPRGSEDSRTFSASAEMLPTREAKLAMMATASIPAAADLGAETLSIEPQANMDRAPSRIVQSNGQQARSGGGQTEVWRNVAEIQKKLSGKLKTKVNGAASESSLQLALENKELSAEQDRYVAALQAAGHGADDIVGYAIAINGKVMSADIYASNGLFRKLWPRLLKSAATEAISADHVKDARPTQPDEIVAFLAEDTASSAVDDPAISMPGVTRATRDGKDAYDTVTRMQDGTVLHRAKVKR